MAIEYKITFKNETTESSTSPISGDYSESNTATAQATTEASGGTQAGKMIAGLVSYKTVKNFATQIVSNEVSLVQLKTGSNEMQERANYINTWANRGLSIVEAGVGGAMVGGPVGALVGAGLALVSVATSTIMTYSQNQRRLNLSRELENVSIQMNYIRAGANGSRQR